MHTHAGACIRACTHPRAPRPACRTQPESAKPKAKQAAVKAEADGDQGAAAGPGSKQAAAKREEGAGNQKKAAVKKEGGGGSKKAAAAVKQEEGGEAAKARVKRERKEFDMPGQTKETPPEVRACARACVCVRACACACVRACVCVLVQAMRIEHARVCMRACVRLRQQPPRGWRPRWVPTTVPRAD